MNTAIQTTGANDHATDVATLFNKLVLQSDLSQLSELELVQYYNAVCERAGLDPLTKPFEVLSLNGKKTLYATKTATAQLTKNHSLSLHIVDKGKLDDTFYAVARVVKKDGSAVDDIGVVPIANLRGEAMSNAMMKAITKAKRRAILSAFGVGLNDETELETLPGATLHRDAINPAIAAPMTEQETEALNGLRAMLVSATNADELTSYVMEIRTQPQLIRDALRDAIKVAANNLGVVWLNGKFQKQGAQ